MHFLSRAISKEPKMLIVVIFLLALVPSLPTAAYATLPPPYDKAPFITDGLGNAFFIEDGGFFQNPRRGFTSLIAFIGTDLTPGSLILDFPAPFVDGPGNDLALLTSSERWGPLARTALFQFYRSGTFVGSFSANLAPSGLLEFELPGEGIVADRIVITNLTPDPPGINEDALMVFVDAGVAHSAKGSTAASFLSFPLRNKSPFTAVINSVFDHSMTTTYCPDGVVRAYTGEEGRGEFGEDPDFGVNFDCDRDGNKEPQEKLHAFAKSQQEAGLSGRAFLVNGHYSGGAFLSYDGHPGYDYRTKDQMQDGTLCSNGSFCSEGKTEVLAAGPGSVVCVSLRIANGADMDRVEPVNLNPCTEGQSQGEIKIDHGNGYFTIYLHLSSAEVHAGEAVKQRQKIGFSGETGAGAGNAHLHFEVRKGAAPVDPYSDGLWKIPTIINSLVSFEPLASTFKTTSNTTGCPSGFVGKFMFNGKLTNRNSSPLLSNLSAMVFLLSNGNLLQNADGGPGGVGARLTITHTGNFSDRVLSPGEFVDVPFSICLKNRNRFSFFVDVLGVVDDD